MMGKITTLFVLLLLSFLYYNAGSDLLLVIMIFVSLVSLKYEGQDVKKILAGLFVLSLLLSVMYLDKAFQMVYERFAVLSYVFLLTMVIILVGEYLLEKKNE